MDKPYEEPKGGSYERDPATGQLRLVHRTEAAPSAEPEKDGQADNTPANRDRKGK